MMGDMVRRIQTTPVRVIVAISVLTLGVLLVALNPGLWFAALLGVVVVVVIGLFIWNPKGAAIGLAGVAVLAVVIAVAALGFNGAYCCAGESSSVLRQTTATFDDENDVWRVEDRFLVPPEAREEANAFLVDEAAANLPEGETLSEENRAADTLLLEQLADAGWIREPDLDGSLVFSRSEERISAEIAPYPPTTKLSIPVDDISLAHGLFSFVSGEGSTLTLSGPKNLVMSTDPISDSSRVPDGDQREVSLFDGFPVTTVSIEAASPLVREEPFTALTRFSTAWFAAWIVATLFGIAAGVLKDWVTELVAGVVAKIKERLKPAPAPAAPKRKKKA